MKIIVDFHEISYAASWAYSSAIVYNYSLKTILIILMSSGKPFDMNNLMNPTGKQFDSSGKRRTHVCTPQQLVVNLLNNFLNSI